MTGVELKAFYRRYNDCCNRHDVAALGEFVHDQVQVNGQTIGIDEYRSRFSHVIASIPDHRWHIEHLIAEDDWIAVHFTNTGTFQGSFLLISSGPKQVRTMEFDFYRIANGKIAEVWGTADNLVTLRQLLGENIEI